MSADTKERNVPLSMAPFPESTPQQAFARALAAFQASRPKIGKDSKADTGTFSYRYAGLPDVLDATMPVLATFGLSFYAAPTLREDGAFVLRYGLMHEAGHEVGGDYPLPSSANSQQIGSAITYGRRYCFTSVTGIAPDEDDDGAKASDARTTALPRAPRTRGATTRHNGPDDPTTHVDEWTVQTDTAWLSNARTRLTACGTVGEVRGLWTEAAQVQAEGRLAHDDAQAFKDEMTARTAELQGEVT